MSCLVLQLAGRAQGTVLFRNTAEIVGADAVVRDQQTGYLLSGTNCLAQLYGGPDGASTDALWAVDDPPAAFGTGGGAGRIDTRADPERIINGVPPGAVATLQVRAWTAMSGGTYEEAVATAASTRDSRHRFGSSILIRVALGGVVVHPEVPPSLPAHLTGLKSFSIAPYPYRLEALRTGSSLRLSWPAADTNYVLEATATLFNEAWAPVEAAPSVEGDQQVLVVGIGTTSQFYRLRLR